MYYLKTLGGFSLHQGGPSGRTILSQSKPLVLIALLATFPGRSARREQLAELIWPDVDLRRARGSLRQALFSLSKSLDRSIVDSEEGTVELLAGRFDCDLWRFEEALEAEEFERATGLYEGPFLAGFERKLGSELEHWIEAVNERVRAGLEAAYHHVVEDALAEDRIEDAVAAARRYAGLNPLDERAQLTLIRTLRAAGDEVAVLQAYWAYRTLLREELDDEPSAELEDTIERGRFGGSDGGRSPRIRHLEGPEITEELVVALSKVQARERRAGLRRVLSSAAIGAAAGIAVLVIGLVAAAGWWEGRIVTADPLGRLTADLYITREADHGERFWKLAVRGSDVELERTALSGADVLAPDGSVVATQVRSSNGSDLALRDPENGSTRAITTWPPDDHPMDWSPDSRYLLYTSGTPQNEARDYDNPLYVYDRVTESHRQLPIEIDRHRVYQAAWSPDGTRIAFVADPEGQADVFVADLDGGRVLNVSRHPARDEQPVWSPSGSRLAFTSWRSGDGDIYSARADGADLRLEASTPREERHPVWLTDLVIAYTSNAEGPREVWAINIRNGEARPLTELGDVTRLMYQPASQARRPWIDRVRIEPAITVVSPGEQLDLSLTVRDAEGHPIHGVHAPVTWSVTHPRVLEILDGSLIRVLETGTASIVASLVDWRADTLELSARPLVVRDLEPIFFEDWRRGIRPARWSVQGEPRPYTRPEGGPDGGGIFINNGDENYLSGLISRDAFPVRNGISVECWGRLPYTGQDYQTFIVGLYDESGRNVAAPLDQGSPFVRLDFTGPSAWHDILATLGTVDGNVPVDPPEEPQRWHLYTLQIAPDGTVSYLVDGQLRRRMATRLDLADDSRAYVGVGGRSLDTEIAHGTLHVYPAARYSLPEDDELAPSEGGLTTANLGPNRR